MIDKTSLKILQELCHEGRYANIELSRKLGISEVTVAKKINDLIAKGIILIKAMPNPSIVGYHHQAFIGLTVDLMKTEDICNWLTGNIHTHMVSTCFGRFNILLIVFFKDRELLQDFINKELAGREGIHDVEVYYIYEDIKHSNDIFPDSLPEDKLELLDELDKKIISELFRDGRPNYAEFAGKLGISKPTVSRRISRLLKESYIRILAIPNLAKLGYSANAYVVLKAEYNEIENICRQLMNFPEVHLLIKLLNDFNILFGVYAVNPHELYEFLKLKIGNIKGINKIESFIRADFSYFSADALLMSSLRN